VPSGDRVIYSGPFRPPPAALMERAIGWRHVKRHVSDHRWEPIAWQIVYPDSILIVDYETELATRDSCLWEP
jgi:hypothetical protein